MRPEQITKNNAKYYAMSELAAPNERVGYGDVTRQYRRFSEITYFVGDMSSSVIDVGCGNGEMYQHLLSLGFDGSYIGVDVNQPLISEARQRFPEVTFECAQLADLSEIVCDYTLLSGAFNFDYGQSLDDIKDTIRRMVDVSNRKAIFNGIGTNVNRVDEGTFYIDLWELCEWLEREFSLPIEVRHGFIACNFTVSVSKTMA